MIAAALASPPMSANDGVIERFTSRFSGRSFKLRVPPPEAAMHDLVKEAHHICQSSAPTSKEYDAAMKGEIARLLSEKGIFWSKVWPAGLALGFHLLENPSLCKCKSVLELGAGLGIGGVCAAAAGASQVVVTDIEPKGLTFATRSAQDNGLNAKGAFITAVWDWNGRPPAGLDGPYELVLAGDVIYCDEHAPRLGTLLAALIKPGGTVLFSDSLERPYKLSHQSELCTRLQRGGFSQTLCVDVDVDATIVQQGGLRGAIAAGRNVRLLSYTRGATR